LSRPRFDRFAYEASNGVKLSSLEKLPSQQILWPLLRSYGAIIFAILLHDIKSRFFGNGLGQIAMLLWPFIHILVLVTIFVFSGRIAPYGSSLLLYSSIGILPFIIFAYSSRSIMYTVVQNRVFLNYPIITLLDLIAARALLETLSNCVLTAVVILVLVMLDVDVAPAHWADAATAWAGCIVLSIGLGVLNGAIAALFELWILVYVLFMITMYASSGILFIPSSLPAPIRDVLAWHPLLQVIEWMRAAYYSDYSSVVLDREYVFRFSLVCLAAGLLLERFTRRLRRS
jgi:capsular polysaccharide transport system permease protein